MKYEHGENTAVNTRNGVSKKTLRTGSGMVQIDVPRDRNGTFEPLCVKKHVREIDSFDEKIISMYARG